MTVFTGASLLGMKELTEKFYDLKTAPDARKMSVIILNASDRVRDQIKSNIRARVRKRTGLLEKSIISKKIKKGSRKGRNEAFVRVDRFISGTYKGKTVRPIKYAHLVEFGTRGAGGIGFFRKGVDKEMPRAQREIRIGLLKILRDIEKKRAIKSVRG